jgi:hypothetical protein
MALPGTCGSVTSLIHSSQEKTKDKEKSGLSFINPGPFVNIYNKKCLVTVFKRIENPVHTDSYPEYSFLANDFPGTAWMGFVGQFPDFPA